MEAARPVRDKGELKKGYAARSQSQHGISDASRRKSEKTFSQQTASSSIRHAVRGES
jgi:hypothetical protein